MLAVLLVCTIGQSHWECQRPTARIVITHKTEAQLPYPCLMEAQQYAAMNSVTSRLKEGEWLKLSCETGHGQLADDQL
jgi:hypothetical protein